MANEASKSPASLARTQADHGAQLTHPDLLDADVRWRSERLFTAEELNFETPAAAANWMINLTCRPNIEQLRPALLNLKRELELVESSKRTSKPERQLAREVGQWLTVWLQNPAIFEDWFELRRKTQEFMRVFGP